MLRFPAQTSMREESCLIGVERISRPWRFFFLWGGGGGRILWVLLKTGALNGKRSHDTGKPRDRVEHTKGRALEERAKVWGSAVVTHCVQGKAALEDLLECGGRTSSRRLRNTGNSCLLNWALGPSHSALSTLTGSIPLRLPYQEMPRSNTRASRMQSSGVTVSCWQW